MSFSLMDSTSESTLTDEKLERVFREIEEASERRAREEEEKEKDSDPSPLDPVLQALSNATSLAELKKQRRRQSSISVSRVGSHADVPAELQGPGSPVPWNAPPLYRTTTQTSATSSLSSSSSYISDHGGSNGGGAGFRRHYEEENHTTQKETIAGRRNTLTKAMSTALSRTLTRMRSRGAINEVEKEVVIGVAVHEARVETTVEADAVEEVGRGNDGTAAEPGAGVPAVASLPRVATLSHIEAVGSSADATSDAGPSRRVSISAAVGPKTQTSTLAEAAGGRSRSGSVGKLRGILPPLRSQASSNSNSTSTSEAKDKDKDKEGKEKEVKEKKEKEKKEKEKKEKEKEKEVKQQQVVVQDSSPASISGSGISATASSSGTTSGTISGGSGGMNGSGPGSAKEKVPDKNANGKASKRLSSFAKVLAQRLKRKGSGEGSDSEKKDKEKEKEKDRGKEKGKKSSDVWDKDNNKKSKSAKDSYISISASPLPPTVSSFPQPQPQQLPASEILDQPILKSPHLAAPASIPNLKALARVQVTEGGSGSGGLGALPPSPRRSPSAAEVPLPASPNGTTTHPLSPRSPASTSSLPVSIAVTSSDGHGRRGTKEGDGDGDGAGENVEPSMVPLPASPTCEAASFDSQQGRVCTSGKWERLPPSALPDSDFGPVSREPSEHSLHSGENTPVEGTSPLSSPVRTESGVNFTFAVGVDAEGARDREQERGRGGAEVVEEKENEGVETKAETRRSELLQMEMERKEGVVVGEEEKANVISAPAVQTSSTR